MSLSMNLAAQLAMNELQTLGDLLAIQIRYTTIKGRWSFVMAVAALAHV